jgi:hypothetical protein
MRFDGYTPTRVSDADIESIIDGMTTVSDAIALSYNAYGHVFYQLTFPTGNRSLLFDTTTNLWSETQTGIGSIQRHVGNLGITFNAQNYCSDAHSGNIYQFSATAYTDNGTPIPRQVTSKHIRNKGDYFGIDEIFLDVETGVGLQSGQGVNPQMSVETSKDGGRTFGMPRLKPMGMTGQYKTPRLVWHRFGRARDFVFRFTVTDPVKFVIAGGSAVIRA